MDDSRAAFLLGFSGPHAADWAGQGARPSQVSNHTTHAELAEWGCIRLKQLLPPLLTRNHPLRLLACFA